MSMKTNRQTSKVRFRNRRRGSRRLSNGQTTYCWSPFAFWSMAGSVRIRGLRFPRKCRAGSRRGLLLTSRLTCLVRTRSSFIGGAPCLPWQHVCALLAGCMEPNRGGQVRGKGWVEEGGKGKEGIIREVRD